MHTHIQRRNQVNRRHIKITYLLTAPEPARDHEHEYYYYYYYYYY